MKKFTLLAGVSLITFSCLFSNNYYVNTRTDSLTGSLRAAIILSNQHIGADSIILLLDASDTIRLTSSLPLITDTLVVTGPVGQNPTISGDSVNYYSGFNSSAPLTLNYINVFKCLMRGMGGGAAVRAKILKMNYCFIYGNRMHSTGTNKPDPLPALPPGLGGAVSATYVWANHCTFTKNSCTGTNTAAPNYGGAVGASNGHFLYCTFANNRSYSQGGAIAILGFDSSAIMPIDIYHCVFTGNYTPYGASIFLNPVRPGAIISGNIMWNDSLGDPMFGGHVFVVYGPYIAQSAGCNWFKDTLNNLHLLVHASDHWATDPQFGPIGYYNDCVPTIPVQNTTVAQGLSNCLAQSYFTVRATLLSSASVCGSPCDGTASAIPSWGTPPYRYHWAYNNDSTQTLYHLCGGKYAVTVTDALGDSAVDSITVAQPTVLLSYGSVTGADCADLNGSASIHPNSGVPPYNFIWNTGNTDSSLSNLSGGNYSVTVIDVNGCSSSTNLNVSTRYLSISTSAINTFCGLSVGSASVSAYSPGYSHTYRWNTGATSQTISNIAAGIYLVTVTTSGNCSATATARVDSNMALSMYSLNTTCGLNNGSATVTILNSVPPFSYAWSNGGTTASIAQLSTGSYTVTAYSSGNCSATSSATISSISGVYCMISTSNTHCGQGDGAAFATITAGGAPFSYHWSNGDTTQGIANLNGGIFSVTVTDANSCTTSATGTVASTGSGSVTLNTSHIDDSCSRQSGSASAYVTSGAGPFSYLWNNSQTGSSIFNLNAGTYTVTVSDGNACSATGAVTISSTPALVIHAVASAAHCGNHDGRVIAMINSGESPFSFIWNNGDTLSTAANLSQGNFSVTVTDANTCSATASGIVTSTARVSLTTSHIDDVCSQYTGSATVMVTSGAGPFAYLWNNGQNSSSIFNLIAGTYTLTVIDGNACSATGAVTVTTTPALVIHTVTTGAHCGNQDGSATAMINSGESPFTFIWNNGDSLSTATNLSQGNFSVTVTDANTCSATASGIITSTSSVAISISHIDDSCSRHTGSAMVTVASGTGPFSYLWNNGATAAGIFNLGASSFRVTVTDANLCNAETMITISSLGSLDISVIAVDDNCERHVGSAMVQISAGQSPYSYLWNNGETSSGISNLNAGTYSVTVSDGNTCSATGAVAVASSPALIIQATTTAAHCGTRDGSVAVMINSGEGPFSFIWNNGDSSSTAMNLSDGNFSVTVTDANTCSASTGTQVDLLDLPPVNIISDKTNLCHGDSAQICAPSGFNSYVWNSGESANCLYAHSGGNYHVVVTDNSNCTAISNQIEISEYAALIATIIFRNDTLFASEAVDYEWRLNNDPIPGTNSNFYEVQAAGSYTVQMTDRNGCSAISEPFVISGIESAVKDEISIFPNPTSTGIWQLTVSNNLVGSNCDIFDAEGRIVFHSLITSRQSPLTSDLSAGIYLLRIGSARASIVRKLIRM